MSWLVKDNNMTAMLKTSKLNLKLAIKWLKHQTKLDLQHLLPGRNYPPFSPNSFECTLSDRHCVRHVSDVDGCVSDGERTP